MAGKATAMGAATANPYLIGAGLAADIGGALLGGGNEAPQTADNLVSPEQRALLLELIKQQYLGGDAGLGADLKAGTSTMAAELARRGISPTSGTYWGDDAMGGVYSGAIAKAAQNRFQNLYSLIGATPATSLTKGYGDWGEKGGTWTPTGWSATPGWKGTLGESKLVQSVKNRWGY